MATLTHIATSEFWNNGDVISINTACVDTQGNFVPSIAFTVGGSKETSEAISEGSVLTFDSQVMRMGTNEVKTLKQILTEGENPSFSLT